MPANPPPEVQAAVLIQEAAEKDTEAEMRLERGDFEGAAQLELENKRSLQDFFTHFGSQLQQENSASAEHFTACSSRYETLEQDLRRQDLSKEAKRKRARWAQKLHADSRSSHNEL